MTLAGKRKEQGCFVSARGIREEGGKASPRRGSVVARAPRARRIIVTKNEEGDDGSRVCALPTRRAGARARKNKAQLKMG